MDSALLQAVLNRLKASRLDDDVARLVVAACHGPEELERVLGGAAPGEDRAESAAEQVEPAGAYLARITVEGFRGIGPEAALNLVPGPGLTLVAGRNGAGKSSFAEAVELLLTERNYRWDADGRAVVWKDGWRNVHHGERTRLTASLLVEGRVGPTKVSREWTADQRLTDGAVLVQHHGEPVSGPEALGWRQALDRYRPFLSYNELGAMFDIGPTKLYDSLAFVLGLNDLTEAELCLKAAQRARTELVKEAGADKDRLCDVLDGLDDERAVRCLAHLRGKRPDLDAVAAVLTGGAEGGGADGGVLRTLRSLVSLAAPEGQAVAACVKRLAGAAERLDRFAGTDADRARRTARLLEEALALHAAHGDGDCPVCRRPRALNPAWRDAAATEVTGLRRLAADCEAAEREVRAACHEAHALLASPPSVLPARPSAGVDTAELTATWTAWAGGSSLSEPRELAGHFAAHLHVLIEQVAEVRKRAGAELALREDRWRPAAEQLGGWLPKARAAQHAEVAGKRLKAAQRWLANAAGDLRNDRFQPIAGRAMELWQLLRHDSNVDIKTIMFEGTGVRRRVDLGVNVDGVGSAALSVMSQGELNALALSLFLPRAMLPESPFRFMLIDDPVQSMDPAKVDGLARVLEQAAITRQVVVFTHDDRLPEAVRRLGIDARVLEVTRQQQSVVHVRAAHDPVRRCLDDARAVAKDPNLPAHVASRLVPVFCRQALEAACQDAARRRLLADGKPHAAVERELQTAQKLVPLAALALFGDAGRASEVMGTLNRRFGHALATTFKQIKQGAHDGWQGNLLNLMDDTRQLVTELSKL